MKFWQERRFFTKISNRIYWYDYCNFCLWKHPIGASAKGMQNMARNQTNYLSLACVALASLLVVSTSLLADEAPAPEVPAPAPVEPTPAPAVEPTPEAPATDTVEARKYPCHGDYSLQYRVRWSHEDSDQDVFQYLNIAFGDPRADAISGQLSMRASWDVDGRSGKTGYYTFDSLADTYDNPFNVKLYSAYVDARHFGLIDLLRAGRQVMTEMPVTLHFDGGRVETWKFQQLKNLQIGFFGGAPVHLYENSSNSDYLIGAYAKCQPWSGGRLQLDWTHFNDQYLTTKRQSELYGIGLWQRFFEDFQFYGRFNRLDEKNRDAEARLIYFSQPLELNINASYYALLEPQNQLAIDIDPFTQALLALNPYWQTRLTIQKSFLTYFDLIAGGTVRQLFDPQDIAPNNREFASAFATLSSSGWLASGLEMDLTWEAYDAHKFGGTTQTVSGDVGYRYRREIAENKFKDLWMVQAGSSYSLYKYDYFLAQEVMRTRTWYAKAWWKITDWARLDARFEHESSDVGEYSLFASSVRLQY